MNYSNITIFFLISNLSGYDLTLATSIYNTNPFVTIFNPPHVAIVFYIFSVLVVLCFIIL
jgi:hypothetical protein